MFDFIPSQCQYCRLVPQRCRFKRLSHTHMYHICTGMSCKLPAFMGSAQLPSGAMIDVCMDTEPPLRVPLSTPVSIALYLKLIYYNLSHISLPLRRRRCKQRTANFGPDHSDTCHYPTSCDSFKLSTSLQTRKYPLVLERKNRIHQHTHTKNYQKNLY